MRPAGRLRCDTTTLYIVAILSVGSKFVLLIIISLRSFASLLGKFILLTLYPPIRQRDSDESEGNSSSSESNSESGEENDNFPSDSEYIF